MLVGGRSQSLSSSDIKCFVCTKVKPYGLCPAHAQWVAAMSLDYDTPTAGNFLHFIY